jgi:hypothetical protein
MKKFLSIIIFSLLLGGNVYAEEITVKSLLDEGYKVKICTVKIKKISGVSNYSKCMTP